MSTTTTQPATEKKTRPRKTPAADANLAQQVAELQKKVQALESGKARRGAKAEKQKRQGEPSRWNYYTAYFSIKMKQADPKRKQTDIIKQISLQWKSGDSEKWVLTPEIKALVDQNKAKKLAEKAAPKAAPKA